MPSAGGKQRNLAASNHRGNLAQAMGIMRGNTSGESINLPPNSKRVFTRTCPRNCAELPLESRRPPFGYRYPRNSHGAIFVYQKSNLSIFFSTSPIISASRAAGRLRGRDVARAGAPAWSKIVAELHCTSAMRHALSGQAQQAPPDNNQRHKTMTTEQQRTPLSKLPKGEFVRFGKFESGPVWIKGDYDRATKTYCLTKFDDSCHETFRKGTFAVFAGFEF